LELQGQPAEEHSGVKQALDSRQDLRLHEGGRRVLPHHHWAHYSTAYDGGAGGQTGFYNLMLNRQQFGRCGELVDR